MKLGIGTVQFGQDYGVANRSGKPSIGEAQEIIQRSRQHDISMLDTAIAYGNSEEILGGIGVSDWQIVTKLPGVPTGCLDVARWVEESVAGSLARLKIDSLYGLLLHRPEDLLKPWGKLLFDALRRLKSDGIVKKIGVSIYAPNELDSLINRFLIDIVQAPFNIFDRRMIDSGWLTRLQESGTELHARSIFLQGLLLMPAKARPVQFEQWAPLWLQWQSWLESAGLTPLQACLRYVLSFPEIERVIVGVDTVKQLEEILTAADVNIREFTSPFNCTDFDLISPARWNTP